MTSFFKKIIGSFSKVEEFEKKLSNLKNEVETLSFLVNRQSELIASIARLQNEIALAVYSSQSSEVIAAEKVAASSEIFLINDDDDFMN